ncbi:MAG TPA: adenylate/guanylate cyclase domain-containing protein [Candidatus Dormibacteraeota bacterium]|nr:adenylate/guanylate cyclase domain-containing protein [Candidatus Dormibacteraeota bacterium]
MPTTRRLAAILAADVAGYSRLIGTNEQGTLERLRTIRTELIDAKVAEHKGRIVKTTGDGLLAEFGSSVDALRCATEVQAKMAERNAMIVPEERIEYRMGIHQGDIVVENGDIFGDGVNIAARLEGLAALGGICVSARVQEDVAGKLDLAFRDLGDRSLKNIARSVRVYEVRTDRAAAPASGPRLPQANKPSIAVLPFQNMSGDPDQEYFVDGMVEEIITALSRIRWLFVVARNSSFTYKGRAVDVTQVGRELGARYVLEGSVRKSGGRVRITGQLIDAVTGMHLWADRFDGSLEDVFDLQDEIASSVAGVIEPALQAAETARSVGRPTQDLTAYDLYLRAYAMFLSSASQIPEALRLMTQAIELDPGYGPALAWAAVCCYRLVLDCRSEDPAVQRRMGVDFAQRALQVAGDDPAVLANAAVALAFFGQDIETMLALVERGLALNSNYARGWHISALMRLWAGQPDKAIEYFEASLRLSPYARIGASRTDVGTAYFLCRRFDEAVPKLLLAIQDDPSFPLPYRYLAACYAHMGKLDDARDMIAQLRHITSVTLPDASYLRNADQRELFLSGFRLALGEES